jgi:hypothetical protein
MFKEGGEDEQLIIAPKRYDFYVKDCKEENENAGPLN